MVYDVRRSLSVMRLTYGIIFFIDMDFIQKRKKNGFSLIVGLCWFVRSFFIINKMIKLLTRRVCLRISAMANKRKIHELRQREKDEKKNRIKLTTPRLSFLFSRNSRSI